ncbi:hypothetical protein R84B8_00231 [Treponema sp. R8-4-B8]
MSLSRQHSFWGSLSPLGGLTGAGLLIMASGRLSWAITVAGCLFWVYGLTAITYASLELVGKKKLLPVKGRGVIITCLASFFSSIYLLLFWLLCPFAVMEVFMLLLLVPLFCASPDFIQQVLSMCEGAYIDIFENLSDAVSKAASLAGLLIAFSIIREPLSYCMLSFPGTYQGMITIMYFKSGAFFPMGIFAASAGSLLLLGYFICLYQYWKGRIGNG